MSRGFGGSGWPVGGAAGVMGCMHRPWRGEFKTTVTVVFILSVFLLFWLPYFLLLPVCHLCRHLRVDCFSVHWCTVASWLGLCHSCLNPLVYAWSKPDNRRALCDLLRGKVMRQRKVGPQVVINRKVCTGRTTDPSMTVHVTDTTDAQ